MNAHTTRWGSAFVALLLTLGRAFAADPSALPNTIDRVRGSIVAVGTNLPTRAPTFRFFGTGFVVRDGNLVATNNHVVPDTIDVAKLETLAIAIPQPQGDAIVRPATLVSRDTIHDVAVLRIAGPALPTLKLGDATHVREGESYAFTGFPIGGAIGLFPTTHRATISAMTPIALPPASARGLDAALVQRLRGDRFVIFQLDATAYPGNSGSPMFDVESGDVVAIVNMVFVKGGKETALTQPSGISYAIPITYLEQLIARGRTAVEPAPPP